MTDSSSNQSVLIYGVSRTNVANTGHPSQFPPDWEPTLEGLRP